MKSIPGRRVVIPIAVIVAIIAAVGVGAPRFWPRDPVPEGLPTARPEGEDWIDLLGPEHAGGWKNVTDDKNIFGLGDGMLHIYGRSLVPLRYVGFAGQTFGDFDLHLEYKVSRHANSGVFLRAQPGDPVYRGFEIQILDDYGKAPTKNRSAAMYDVATPMFNMSRPAGEWNSFDISVEGPQVIVIMNGWKVIDVDLSRMTKPYGKFEVAYQDLPREGIIALQDHGGEVWYRNIYVRPK
jgi:hypothetical protein